ncbi:hypothetical protein HRG_014961 [Hirsutella rhossiliensis]
MAPTTSETPASLDGPADDHDCIEKRRLEWAATSGPQKLTTDLHELLLTDSDQDLVQQFAHTVLAAQENPTPFTAKTGRTSGTLDAAWLLRWTVERSSTREKVARQILERALANQKELGRQARARQQDLMDYTDQIRAIVDYVHSPDPAQYNQDQDPEPLDNGSNPRYADWKAAGQAHEVLAPYLAKQDDLEIRSVGQIFELLELHKKLTGQIRLNSQDIYERYEELTFAQYRDRMTARYLVQVDALED